MTFGEFHPPGIWTSSPYSMPTKPRRPGLLLDRDGVLVVERNYLHRPQDVELIPEALQLIRQARANGIPVAVVTNQSGIARGLFGWEDFFAVEQQIGRLLAENGTSVDLTAVCPFHPEFTPGYCTEHDRWRKPGPGMLHFAGERLGLDLRRSWLVGDKANDIRAAKAAGLAGAVFLRGQYREEDAAAACADEGFAVRVVEETGLVDAVPLMRPAV